MKKLYLVLYSAIGGAIIAIGLLFGAAYFPSPVKINSILYIGLGLLITGFIILYFIVIVYIAQSLIGEIKKESKGQ
ncbi:MAG: hypothetical protein ABH874_04775 [Methanobacteriota archaeon]|jgi:hypothetical protein|nr:hypothetical protein [Candidatus Hydrothermarchaeota archaeon]